MAGHSKWSNIKHKKAREDAKRNRAFTKLSRKIAVAARQGGGDIEYNPDLRLAVDKANAANMPKDTIERAIQRGTGELEGVDFEEYTYEGYGPDGVAVIVDVVSDNRNRSVAELRHLFDKNGGNLGEDGCVAWQFERLGLLQVDPASVDDYESFALEAIELGADDVRRGEDDDGEPVYEVLTDYTELHVMDQKVREAGLAVKNRELTREPNVEIDLDVSQAKRFLRLYEALDDHDDIQAIYTNCSIDDEVRDELAR